MHYKTIFLTFFIFICLFSAPSSAQDGSSISKFMTNNMGDQSMSAKIWKIRATNSMTIAKQKVMNDFAIWCGIESEKENGSDEPCQVYANEAPAVESTLLSAIPVTELIIQWLKSSEQNAENKNHLKVLQEQLSEMRGIPTPLHSMIENQHENSVNGK